MTEPYPKDARRFPTPQQLALAKNTADLTDADIEAIVEDSEYAEQMRNSLWAQRAEAQMSDAGAATAVPERRPVLFIQFDDSNVTLAQRVDDLLLAIAVTGNYTYRSSWDAGMETLEVFERD